MSSQPPEDSTPSLPESAPDEPSSPTASNPQPPSGSRLPDAAAPKATSSASESELPVTAARPLAEPGVEDPDIAEVVDATPSPTPGAPAVQSLSRDPSQSTERSPETPDPDRPIRLSSRERQRESAALANLAKTLVDMKPAKFARLELPAEVVEAVVVGRTLERAARVRQLRRVAKVLREHEIERVPDTSTRQSPAHRQHVTQEQLYEQWRDRLYAEGDKTLAQFIDEHPMVDPQQLRQLLRQARRKPGSGKSKQALTAVLRLIREVFEVEASVRKASSPPPDDG